MKKSNGKSWVKHQFLHFCIQNLKEELEKMYVVDLVIVANQRIKALTSEIPTILITIKPLSIKIVGRSDIIKISVIMH